MKAELIADYQCEVGEGPLWHPMEKRVYWTDIKQGRMFRYDPLAEIHEQFYEGAMVGGFTIQADGSLLLFMEEGAIAIWREGTLTYIIDKIPGEQNNRFNDVIADPAGRVFCGMMRLDEQSGGKLYRLDTDGSIKVVIEKVQLSNGMAFTGDKRHMYYTDSLARQIYVFDYDESNGSITNQNVFLKIPDETTIPDGMTLDAEDYVWSARWDGWSIFRYAPDGSYDRQIRLPAKQVSSLTFGGDDYTDIYVTTAGGQDKANNGSGAGALFRIRSGIKGKPEFLSKIGM